MTLAYMGTEGEEEVRNLRQPRPLTKYTSNSFRIPQIVMGFLLTNTPYTSTCIFIHGVCMVVLGKTNIQL